MGNNDPSDGRRVSLQVKGIPERTATLKGKKETLSTKGWTNIAHKNKGRRERGGRTSQEEREVSRGIPCPRKLLAGGEGNEDTQGERGDVEAIGGASGPLIQSCTGQIEAGKTLTKKKVITGTKAQEEGLESTASKEGINEKR